VSTAASFELGFAQSDYVICETVNNDVPWRADVMQDYHPLNKQGRTVAPAERPGLGVEVDEAAVAKHPFQQEVLQRVFYADGSVGDW
jgi:galactonate dehydratase